MMQARPRWPRSRWHNAPVGGRRPPRRRPGGRRTASTARCRPPGRRGQRREGLRGGPPAFIRRCRDRGRDRVTVASARVQRTAANGSGAPPRNAAGSPLGTTSTWPCRTRSGSPGTAARDTGPGRLGAPRPSRKVPGSVVSRSRSGCHGSTSRGQLAGPLGEAGAASHSASDRSPTGRGPARPGRARTTRSSTNRERAETRGR